MGRTRNYPLPYAWRYRNWVIDAFKEDKPYDAFVREQIAGDLLEHAEAADHEAAITATGLLTLGSHDLNERDLAKFRMDVADEQINVVMRGVLATTAGCAVATIINSTPFQRPTITLWRESFAAQSCSPATKPRIRVKISPPICWSN